MSGFADQVNGEREARVLLSLLAQPDDRFTGGMLARLGGVETIALLDSDDPHDAVDTARLGVWRASLRRAAEHMDISREVGTRLDGKYKTLIPGDQDWPTVMDDLGTRAPYVLWTEGAARLLNFRLDDKATITGARAASSYGVNVAQELTDDLAQDGRIAVAGGAYGIEAEVHRQALARDGATVAVLAGGINRNYPQGNADLLDRVRHEGVVVSEQPPGAVPTRGRFLLCNRVGRGRCSFRVARGRRRCAHSGPSCRCSAWTDHKRDQHGPEPSDLGWTGTDGHERSRCRSAHGPRCRRPFTLACMIVLGPGCGTLAHARPATGPRPVDHRRLLS